MKQQIEELIKEIEARKSKYQFFLDSCASLGFSSEHKTWNALVKEQNTILNSLEELIK